MDSFDHVAATEHAEGVTQAGEVFAWAPRAAGLDGELFVADAVRFADYDLIVQPPDGTFTEVGYLPITGFSLAGEAVAPAGLNDPGGAGWGAYMRITGSGTTGLSPLGTPGASYDELSYEIVGFNGTATYGFDADGNVVVAGELGDVVTLLSGSLITGRIDFVPTDTGPAIEGTVSLTVDEVAPRFAAGLLGALNLTIVHPPGDYSFTSPTTVRVAATSGTDGTFSAAAPEPGPTEAHPLGDGEAPMWPSCAASDFDLG